MLSQVNQTALRLSTYKITEGNISLVFFFSSFVEHSSLIHFCLTDATMNDAMAGAIPQETTGIPAQGLQVVPVYQGLKPKKPVIEEGTYSIIVV